MKEIQRNWNAEMIHPLSDQGVGTQSAFVSTIFTVNNLNSEYLLHISALGLYICFINGKRVQDDLLTPGWTSYDVRIPYQSYKIDDYLVSGENKIEIWLADGWYRSKLLWKEGIYNCWGDKIAAIAEIVVSEGSTLLKTDQQWKSGLLPILKSGIYFGESYDARLDIQTTDKVETIEFDKGKLVLHQGGPVKELEAFQIRKKWQDAEGRYLFDFGQNLAGYPEIEISGDPGSKIIIEHAEVLDKNGVFTNENYRGAEARIEYILAGNGIEIFKPHFTFFGYRYARVTVIGNVDIKSIKSIPISSVQELQAQFECGHSLVNRLVQNTIWSQRSNFIEVPTDCPQRDERLGWTGDAQVFAATACYLHNSHKFMTKWLQDVMIDQRPDGAIPHVVPDPTKLHEARYPNFFGSTGWGDVICVMPWVLYQHYGDVDVLVNTLPAMEKWVDYVWSISDGPIVHTPREWESRGFTFGDWLQPKGEMSTAKPWPTIGDDSAATIYLYIAAKLTEKVALTIGNKEIANKMNQRASLVKSEFEKEFITPNGRLLYDDQTSYALCILYDLIPERFSAAAHEYFVKTIKRSEGKIGTGFIGTPALLPALVKIGEFELAELLFLQEEVPGWLYQVKNGATTIWERWDAIQEDGTIFEPSMNSYNHYAYGAVCQFLFESVAGFRPDETDPNFRNIIIEPIIFPKLSPVKAHHKTHFGEIKINWEYKNGTVNYHLTVPKDTTATVILNNKYQNIEIDSADIISKKDGKSIINLKSGQYSIDFNIDF